MLNTFLFRDTLSKELEGNKNFLAEKLFFVKNNYKRNPKNLDMELDLTKNLAWAFGWEDAGSQGFWDAVSNYGTIQDTY